MINHAQTRILFANLIIATIVFIPAASFASTTNGTIQNQYAWGENVGWVNFLPTDGDIHITDSTITGYAWDPNYGWINFAPTQSGVINDGSGNLSGYAWSTGGGYINFSGVVINSSGKFTGIASGVTYGQLTFDCNQCNVTTDWRPSSARPVTTTSSSGGGSIWRTFGTGVSTATSSTVNTITNWVNNLFGKNQEGQQDNQNQTEGQTDTFISSSNSTSTQYLNQTENVTKVNNENILFKYWLKIVGAFVIIVVLIILVLKFLKFKN